MDRRVPLLHRLELNNGYDYEIIVIDGSALGTSNSTDGITVGSTFCVAKDDGSNAVTITFNEPLAYAPIVYYQPITANVVVQETSTAVDKIVYTTVQGADYSTGSADADVRILLYIPRGLSVV